ncbi:MAG: hypothetical protein K9J37_19160 [Saprospiraceae bacterium]|nr:hypothetical protein [Saprospiraceae bacterium]MCF8252044.1 hypothetical protein [Saprospiraceae bacterium]MCF8281733.1 hypothetical protein [Bacteroidales bacterium]MCF8310379.1 hypothetical protein [Saprospiraceae bacterium]MCF8439757.1 hypothetical protein [Saprospiraceae bacterium]
MKGSEKLIEIIRQQDIQPAPKWQFSMKNGLAWAGFLAAVVLGAMAFSVILFAIQQTDFNLVSHLSHSRLEMFLGLLPFIWIVFLIAALAIAFYSIQFSKKGYKFTAAKLVGFSALLSILLGTLFFIGGGGHQLEHAFAVNVDLYESIQQKKTKLWSMPKDGYLSGQIEAVNPDFFVLKDFNNKSWKIHYDSAFIAPVVRLEEGETVKLIGKMESIDEFTAKEIRPWGGRGNRMRGN